MWSQCQAAKYGPFNYVSYDRFQYSKNTKFGSFQKELYSKGKKTKKQNKKR